MSTTTQNGNSNNRVFGRSAALVAVASMMLLSACSSSAEKKFENTSAPASSVTNTSAKDSTHKDRPNPYAYLPKVPSFKVASTIVKDGDPLPLAQWSKLFGVPGGEDASPQLSWSGFPAKTKSFVVSMYDPQAPTGSGFWHWAVADIPANKTALPENAGVIKSKDLPAGAFQLGGDAGAPQYVGAAPPAGSGVHDYYITVTALDVPKSGVGPTASGAFLGFNISGHTLARATLKLPTPAAAK
jgi:Raf kinase inhibitor-like YbhB/YbcL family protein